MDERVAFLKKRRAYYESEADRIATRASRVNRALLGITLLTLPRTVDLLDVVIGDEICRADDNHYGACLFDARRGGACLFCYGHKL